MRINYICRNIDPSSQQESIYQISFFSSTFGIVIFALLLLFFPQVLSSVAG